MGIPSNPNDAISFNRRDQGRIAQAVQLVERRPKNQQALRGRWPVGGGGGLVPALTGSGGLPAGTRTNPQSATVTLLVNTTGASLAPATDPVQVTCYSYKSATIGANQVIEMYRFNDFWYLFGADCS